MSASRQPRAIEIKRFVSAAMRIWITLAPPAAAIGFAYGLWRGCTPELATALGFTAFALALSMWGAHRVTLFCAIAPKASPPLLALGVPMLAQTPITLALIFLVGDDYVLNLETRTCGYHRSILGLFAAAAVWGIALVRLRRRLLPRPGAPRQG